MYTGYFVCNEYTTPFTYSVIEHEKKEFRPAIIKRGIVETTLCDYILKDLEFFKTYSDESKNEIKVAWDLFFQENKKSVCLKSDKFKNLFKNIIYPINYSYYFILFVDKENKPINAI